MNQQFFDVSYKILQQPDSSSKTLNSIKNPRSQDHWRLLQPMMQYFFTIAFEPCPINRIDIKLYNVDRLHLTMTNSRNPMQKQIRRTSNLERTKIQPDRLSIVKVGSYFNQDKLVCDRLEVRMESVQPEIMGIQSLIIKCSSLVETTERVMKIEKIGEGFSSGMPKAKKQGKRQQKIKDVIMVQPVKKAIKKPELVEFSQKTKQILLDLDDDWLKKQRQYDIEHDVPPENWLSILAEQLKPNNKTDIQQQYQQKLRKLGFEEIPSFLK